MFEKFWGGISNKRSRKRRELWNRRTMPTEYLKDVANNADKFLDTARNLIRESRLDIEYVEGAYRASLTVDYNKENYRFGCIIENDFLLDCSLIYKAMEKIPYADPSRQASCFKELFQIGVLHRCRYMKRYLWYKLNPPWATRKILGHKAQYYCISNDTLFIGLSDSEFDGY